MESEVARAKADDDCADVARADRIVCGHDRPGLLHGDDHRAAAAQLKRTGESIRARCGRDGVGDRGCSSDCLSVLRRDPSGTFLTGFTR